MELIEIKDISFSYDKKLVLDDISISVKKGEVLGILGPNGCGKTTLLKHINRNLSPEVGCVTIEDTDLQNITKREIAKKIAVVPQTNEIHFSFTVRDIVGMGRMPFMEQFRGETTKDVEIVETAMKKARVIGLADRYVNTMSGGERQRMIIARALAQTPEVMLLDEPTLHLDISNQIEALELVKKLSREDGLTVIIVSHDLSMVAKYCDRIMMIYDHKMLIIGTPEEVLTSENMRKVFSIDAVFEYDQTLGCNSVKIKGSVMDSE